MTKIPPAARAAPIVPCSLLVMLLLGGCYHGGRLKELIPPPAHTGHEPSAPPMGSPFVILRPALTDPLTGVERIVRFEHLSPDGETSHIDLEGFTDQGLQDPVGSCRHVLTQGDTDRLSNAANGAPVCLLSECLEHLVSNGALWFRSTSLIWATEYDSGGNPIDTGWSEQAPTVEPLDVTADPCAEAAARGASLPDDR